jgi:hypothetical protein
MRLKCFLFRKIEFTGSEEGIKEGIENGDRLMCYRAYGVDHLDQCGRVLPWAFDDPPPLNMVSSKDPIPIVAYRHDPVFSA